MPAKGDTKDLVPDFRVRVNGRDLPIEAAADLTMVTVEEDVRAPSMFTLELLNGDTTGAEKPWSDDALFAEGGEVEIRMGYVDSLETVMMGEITGLEPEFAAGDPPMLIVRGYDRRHRLLRGRKTRSFVKMKDSDVASQIARDAGLKAKATGTRVALEYVLQHNQTDLEFLQERAGRIGYEVVVEDNTLHFRPHQHAKKAALTLSLDDGLLEFHPRTSTLMQVGKLEVRAWDPKKKAAITGQAAAGKETTQMGGGTTGPKAADKAFGRTSAATVDRPVSTPAEADQIALGQLDEMALAYVSGDGVSIGRTDLRAGTVVEIEGLGKRFSGPYYVTSTTHSCSPTEGYRTAFTVKRNAT